MLYPTHIAGGMAAGLLISGNAVVSETMLAMLIAGTAALLPDLDSPDSYIGSRVPIVPTALSVTFGHRGALHSLLAGAAWMFLLTMGVKALGVNYNDLILKTFLAGYCSHLILDMANPKGVPLLWPLKIKVGIPLIHTGGVVDKFVVFPALLGWVLFHLYTII